MPQGFHEHFHNHIAPLTENVQDVPFLAEQKTETSTKKSATRPFDAQHSAIEFAALPLMKENDKLRIAKEKEAEKRALKQLFQSGNLENIENFLLDEETKHEAMQKEIQRVQNEYAAELSPATFLIDKDWKILTALELFDKGTFEHSLRTYIIAKEILETRITKLAKEIEQEGVILKQFYLACLFHDLGKLTIPKFIINSVVSDEVWTYLFMELPPEQQDEILIGYSLPFPDAYRSDHEKLHDFFNQHDFRAVTVVPANKAFNKQEELEIFAKRGIDSNLPLMKIIEPHEKESKNILKKLGYGLEALLAGHHHNYNPSKNQDIEDPTSTSALQVMVEITSDIIHTIDVYDALISHRAYSAKFSPLQILSSIIHHVEIGRIKNKWVAASIINDNLKKNDSPDFSQEAQELQLIEKFLKENLRDDEVSFFE